MFSGMMAGYRWPGPFKPRRHQVATSVFSAGKDRCFIFNDIGTGKTASAIWSMDWLMQEGHVKRALIIAPKTTVDYVWGREMMRLIPHRRFGLMLGDRETRLRYLTDQRYQILVINPDALHMLIDWKKINEREVPIGLLPGLNPDLIIVDESTKFKTSKTRRYKSLKFIVGQLNPRLWMMSGKPTPKDPTDIWAPARLVCPTAVPSSFKSFKEQTMYQVSQFTWLHRPNAAEHLAKILEPHSIRFSRDECLDLPSEQRVTLKVDETREQAETRKTLEKELVVLLDKGQITAVNEGVLLSKILQIACGAVYTEGKEVQILKCDGKLAALDDVMDSTDGPVIVYSPFIPPITHILTPWARDAGHRYAVVDGSTSRGTRIEAFDRLQTGHLDVLIAQPDSIQFGITLTKSNTVVWWGLPHNLETYDQATGRIQREGQTRSQYIIHLINSHAEQRVFDRLSQKAGMQGLLLDILRHDV